MEILPKQCVIKDILHKNTQMPIIHIISSEVTDIGHSSYKLGIPLIVKGKIIPMEG